MDEDRGPFGGYRLERELARRAGAVSWLATELATGRRCRVKELSLRAAGFAEAQEEFEAHARSLSRLAHPGLPAFLGFACREEGGDVRCRLVQEFVEGVSLAELVERGDRVTGARLAALLGQAAAALAYLHALDPPFVHRDVRPANLILGRDGRLRLVDPDFRRGRAPGPPPASVLPWMTSGFAPPEALDGAWCPASDVFSLGMCAVYAITGREPPFLGRGGRFDLRREMRAPARILRVLGRMIDPDPAKRYRDGAALAAALAPRPGRRGSPRAASRAARVALAAAAAGVALIVAARVLEERRAAVPPVRPAVAPPRPADRRPAPAREAAPVAPRASERLVAGGDIVVRLFHDGVRVEEITGIPPVFWFRNETRNVVEKPEVLRGEGTHTIAGLPPGRVGMSVRVNLDGANPPVYPGDLDGWTVLQVPESGTLAVDLPLRRIIRLREPVDNNALLAGGRVPCGGGYVLRSPVRIRWDAVAAGVEYSVGVDRMDCRQGYRTAGKAFHVVTPATGVEVALPPSADGECYALHLYAGRGETPVGMLTTHGEGYLAWDFRFTVRD